MEAKPEPTSVQGFPYPDLGLGVPATDPGHPFTSLGSRQWIRHPPSMAELMAFRQGLAMADGGSVGAQAIAMPAPKAAGHPSVPGALPKPPSACAASQVNTA